MTYQPTLESVRRHLVPDWYHDAKLGIFVHWGLFSVPAWAPHGGDIDEQVASHGWERMFANNPYAEWYQNSLRIGGTPTHRHHEATYGRRFAYEDFAPAFRASAERWDPDAWASLIARVGARYCVLTTKHHDGFLLWPGTRTSPHRPGRFATERDIVGEFTQAARARDLRVGLYYSGGLDWTFEQRPVRGYLDVYSTIVQTPDFVGYATAHWQELIERYEPSILWNDIGIPRDLDLARLAAAYYNAIPDGLINDRWGQALPTRIPGPGELINPPAGAHHDFTTPEYARYAAITAAKWESTRGIGHSFGYNQNEGPGDYLTVEDLVRSLVDIVSKNGNLLLNVGPMADGTIPELQRERLVGLGAWLDVNGEAIFGTHPWVTFEGRTDAGLPLRYTLGPEALYATLMETPRSGQIGLPDLVPQERTSVHLLGSPAPLSTGRTNGTLSVSLPSDLVAAPASVLRISPPPRHVAG